MKSKTTTLAVLVPLACLIAGCETVGVASSGNATQSTAVTETVGVQELRREIAVLRDAIEVQRNELQKLQTRQRQLYDDLDYRLRQAEAGGQRPGYQGQQAYGQTSGSVPQSDQQGYYDQGTGQQGTQGQGDLAYGQTQPQGTQAQDGQIQGTQQQAGVASSTDATQAASQNPVSRVTVASAEEQAAYDEAFELLKQSRYDDAVISFRSLTAQFPNGALVDDAEYWIGESHYVTRNFENALIAFDTVVTRYPDSQRVPEAMLKLGYVQYELGQTEAARQTLQQVINRYPGSRVAISAETRLRRIQ